MLHIYSIYKATNIINGKSYIGYDSKWPSRKKDHYRSSFIESYKQYGSWNYKFHCAIRKYGWDVFEWVVIYQSQDSDHCLKEMEPYFIQHYNSYHTGYNMTLGGNGSPGHFHSNSTKFLIQGKRQYQIITLEHKVNIGLGCEKNYIAVDPLGEVYSVKGLKRFCKEYNLGYSCMLNLCRCIRGVSKGRTHHKGWKCYDA